MNKIRRLKKLKKRIDRYDKFIDKCKKWRAIDKKEFRKLMKSLTETELLLYGQKEGFV